MLTMELLLRTVWVLIDLKTISQVGKRCVSLFIDQSWSMIKKVESLAINLFRGKSLLKTSSGPNFAENWPLFENSLFAILAQLDFEKTYITKLISRKV